MRPGERAGDLLAGDVGVRTEHVRVAVADAARGPRDVGGVPRGSAVGRGTYVPVLRTFTAVPVALNEIRAYAQLLASRHLGELLVQVHGGPDRVRPGRQPRDVDPLVGEVGTVQVAPTRRRCPSASRASSSSRTPAWVYLRLVGAPGRAVLRRLVSKKQKPIFASRGRAVSRPQVVGQDPPDVPVVVTVARVAHRRGGPDAAGRRRRSGRRPGRRPRACVVDGAGAADLERAGHRR